MIKRDLFTLKTFPVGTINYMITHFLSFFCSLSMFTEYRMHLLSTVCIFQTKEKSRVPDGFPAQYVRIPWFVSVCFPSLRNAHSLQALGKGLLRSALPRRGTLGKTALCLFCGERKLSSLGWLKKKLNGKIPRGWFSHFLFSQNRCLNVQFPSSGAAHGVNFCAYLTKGISWGITEGGHRPQTTKSTTSCSSPACRSRLQVPLQRIPYKRLYSWRLQNQLLITTFGGSGLCSFLDSVTN